MMLRTWNDNIFLDIRHRLQSAAIHLLEAERNGEAFDSQLVIGVRESYGMVPPVETCAQWVKRELCVSVILYSAYTYVCKYEVPIPIVKSACMYVYT